MLNIALYDDDPELLEALYSDVQDYIIRKQTLAKISRFTNTDDLFSQKQPYDIYILDMMASDVPVGLRVAKQIKKIIPQANIIFISDYPDYAVESYHLGAVMYLLRPLDKNILFTELDKIRNKIKAESFIISTPLGERRLPTNELLYVDIGKRCLCYHMRDGDLFTGQTMRTSFAAAIGALKENPQFIFLPPSLLINLEEIKLLNKDNLTFKNNEILYFPKAQYDKIKEAWKYLK